MAHDHPRGHRAVLTALPVRGSLSADSAALQTHDSLRPPGFVRSVRRGSGPAHQVPLCGKPMPAFSLWEWREIRAQRTQEGRSRDPEQMSAELRANRQLIESKAHEKGRWHDARRLAREQEWKRSRSDPAGPDRILKSSALD